MRENQEINGIKIEAMSNGDMFKRYNALDEQIGLLEGHIENLDNSDYEEFERLEAIIEESWKRDI